jgi:hypothetical protein
MTQIDAGRTKASILVFLLLTFGLSSISPASIGTTERARCAVADVVPRNIGPAYALDFPAELARTGLRWGKVKYQFASYWIPLAYAGAVYLPVWFAGYFDAQSLVLLCY